MNGEILIVILVACMLGFMWYKVIERAESVQKEECVNVKGNLVVVERDIYVNIGLARG